MRASKRATLTKAPPAVIEHPTEPSEDSIHHPETDEPSAAPEPDPTKRKRDASPKSSSERPRPPPILSHLVLGINETLKALEHQIATLKIRLMIMADALNGQLGPKSTLLPTAPPAMALASDPPDEPAPLGIIVVPLLSVSPQSLVSPIPQYCATYNALLHQHAQLAKAVRARLKDPETIVGGQVKEVRVVPLGAVEKEIAAMVGLRRVASLGIRVRTRYLSKSSRRSTLD